MAARAINLSNEGEGPEIADRSESIWRNQRRTDNLGGGVVCIVLSLWTPLPSISAATSVTLPHGKSRGRGANSNYPIPSLSFQHAAAALPFFFFGCHGQGRPLRHGIVDPLMGGKRNLLSGRLLFFASSFAAQFLCGVVRLPPPSSKTHC